MVGVTELSRVAGNFLLQVNYLGGPLGFLGVVTIHLARFLNSLLLVSPADPIAFWGKSEWIMVNAGSSHDFFAAMVAMHVTLAMFNLALGLGLWRRRPWARRLEIALSAWQDSWLRPTASRSVGGGTVEGSRLDRSADSPFSSSSRSYRS